MRKVSIILLFLIAAFAADRDLAGRYTGEWSSAASGNGGAIQFTLVQQPGAAWKCDRTFMYNNGEVKTKMREFKLRDGKLAMLYDFDIDGLSLRSRIRGDWDGTTFRGKYETTSPDGSQQMDNGSWSASQRK